MFGWTRTQPKQAMGCMATHYTQDWAFISLNSDVIQGRESAKIININWFLNLTQFDDSNNSNWNDVSCISIWIHKNDPKNYCQNQKQNQDKKKNKFCHNPRHYKPVRTLEQDKANDPIKTRPVLNRLQDCGSLFQNYYRKLKKIKEWFTY